MNEIQLMERFNSDSEWFQKNIDFLRSIDLTGKFVAIKDKKVLEFGEEIGKVINLVEQQGENSSILFIEFVHPAGSIILL